MTCYEGIYNKYLFSYLMSPAFDSYANHTENAKGVAYPAINDDRLYRAIVPLPPLAEQKRIVAKIEELLPYIERYEKAWSKLKELNKRFPSDMQKSILQFAIQGKLVEQRTEEGTAEMLYKQIQAEKKRLIKAGKIKKEKPLPEIKDDEKPFDIPEGWMWVRLGYAISLLSGQDMTASEYNDNSKGIPYITGASNIEDSCIIINRWTESAKAIAHKDDLLLTCKGTIGKTAILAENQVHIARQIMAITAYIVDIQFIRFFIESSINFLKSQAKSMIPGIERRNVLNLAFPLPPLAEQKRIVAKIEELMPLCERLKFEYS
ncbi:MAG: EcoKI restriction-modification system protein HsdS [Firmicutes bacterium ADurb.Bin356]|nr:MAG: EcoKI restriction-modification system protein HsdS [Firmicutes bacterium ADurb.Bin356]